MVGTAWSGVVCWETGLNCVAFLLPEELGIELALEMSIAWLMGLSWWGSASWWGVILQTERSQLPLLVWAFAWVAGSSLIGDQLGPI